MFGEYDDKFAGMRTFLTYMMTLPGKKLMFMGSEYAQFREWDYENQLEWFMTDYPRHAEMKNFVKTLNHFYLDHPELWEIDDTWDGFEWIEADLSDLNIIAYRRRDKKGGEITVVLNFAPVVRENFPVKVSKMGRYEEILNSDRYDFGGKNCLNEESVRTRAVIDENGNKTNIIDITVPAHGAVILKKQLNK
jgi:1,4-alpha-glucan branching enzyme